MPYRYLAYGLVFNSVIPLPLLTEFGLALSHRPADVTIIIDDDFVIPDYGVNVGDGHFRIAPEINSALYRFDQIGMFSIENGELIRLRPTYPLNEALIVEILFSSPIRTLLHQRGLIVMHASAVAIENKTVAFCGDSGQGKSTLAAHFQVLGYAFVTDDTLAINIASKNEIRVFSAPPQIKLWADSIASIGAPLDQLPRLHDEQSYRNEKRLLQDLKLVQDQPPPLGRIYILETTDVGETHFEFLSPAQALTNVMAYSFIGEIVSAKKRETFKDQAQQLRYFEACAKLARHIPVRRLLRRHDFTEMPAIIEMILQDARD